MDFQNRFEDAENSNTWKNIFFAGIVILLIYLLNH